MEIRSLATFLAIAETGSFTRAGHKLEISQSAVSQQIRTLEDSLGSPLFSRQARKVTLTQAGNVLLPYARQILGKVDEAKALVSDFEGMGRGRVSIGAGGAVCLHVLPDILREFSSRFGRIEVQVTSGFSFETLRHTVDGTVDLGILLLPINNSAVVTSDLGRDELVAIAPPGHPWEQLERVHPKDFVQQSLVTYTRNSHTFRILERFLLEQGVFPTVAMEISDLEAVKRMVAVGLGVSIVAAWTVRPEQENGSLVVRPLGKSGLYRTWGIVRRAKETLTASQRGFISICNAQFAKLVS